MFKYYLQIFTFSFLIISCNTDQIDENLNKRIETKVSNRSSDSSSSSSGGVCGIDVTTTRGSDSEDGCCFFKLEIDFHETYSGGELKIYHDGILVSIASGTVGYTWLQMEVCNDPMLLEIYSGDQLCYSRSISCEDSQCCAEGWVNVEEVVDDNGCCEISITWEGGGCIELMVLYSDGPAVPQEAIPNGRKITICDDSQNFYIYFYTDEGDHLCGYKIIEGNICAI